jgi:phosphatidylglycerol:prolipoprotein diacylglycerol transferase
LDSLFIIDTAGSQIFYPSAYMGAMFLATAVAFWSGVRKGLPPMPWLLAIITGGTLYVVCEKIFTYNLPEWNSVVTGLIFPPTGKRIVLGGVIGLLLGLTFAKKWLGIRAPLLDHYAVALPLGMAVTRLGCLKAGCCYGVPTTLPWGISYGHHSMAFRSQLMNGIVEFNDRFTAPVHPVQVYEMTGCILIAWLVWKMRNRFRAGESLFLLSILCYSSFRFLVEFIRAPLPGTLTPETFLGIKTLQWILAAVIVSASLLLMIRESGFKLKAHVPGATQISQVRQITLLVFISAVIFSIRNWITGYDLILSLVFLFPVGIYWLGKLILQPLNRMIYEKSKNKMA